MGARDEVLSFVENHESWRGECINLIASENISSPSCNRAVGSGMMHKYAEGWPKQRYYQGCRWVDEAELLANSQFYKLFKADFVDLRPVSGACANIALFFGMTQPGDTIMSLHTSHGGHISHAEFGAAGLRGLRVVTFPYNDKEMNIDSDKMIKLIEEEKPKLILFGCSLFLFPHPLSEAREAAEEVEATICYDAAHVLGLMAGGEFQNPFEEGVKIITS
ncbi:MAG: aminotransferase class I/II-fold pyridoxal phosphate-dependent enzyme, partial [Candidatus Methanofastidiosia archaeon]